MPPPPPRHRTAPTAVPADAPQSHLQPQRPPPKLVAQQQIQSLGAEPNIEDMLRIAREHEAMTAAAFKRYDADASGTIDESEVMCLLQDLGMLQELSLHRAGEIVARAFAEHDADSNGVLDFEEFKGFYNAAILEAAGSAPPLTPRRAAPPSIEKARSKAAVAEERLSKVHKQTLGTARVAALDKMFGQLRLVDGKARLLWPLRALSCRAYALLVVLAMCRLAFTASLSPTAQADLEECQLMFGEHFEEVLAQSGGGKADLARQLDRDGDQKVGCCAMLRYVLLSCCAMLRLFLRRMPHG